MKQARRTPGFDCSTTETPAHSLSQNNAQQQQAFSSLSLPFSSSINTMLPISSLCTRTVSHRLIRCGSTASVNRNWGDIHLPAISSVVASAALKSLVEKDEHVRNTMAYCLSFSTDTKSDLQQHNVPQLDGIMKSQLTHCREKMQQQRQQQKRKVPIDTLPLPRTWSDLNNSSRAIVVTESTKPFRIVSVNTAWEQLCGYTLCQARSKTLGSLLHGPKTDAASGTALISQLLASNEAAVTLTNYKASGEAFRNRVRVGIMEEDGDRYFVGVLQQM